MQTRVFMHGSVICEYTQDYVPNKNVSFALSANDTLNGCNLYKSLKLQVETKTSAEQALDNLLAEHIIMLSAIQEDQQKNYTSIDNAVNALIVSGYRGMQYNNVYVIITYAGLEYALSLPASLIGSFLRYNTGRRGLDVFTCRLLPASATLTCPFIGYFAVASKAFYGLKAHLSEVTYDKITIIPAVRNRESNRQAALNQALERLKEIREQAINPQPATQEQATPAPETKAPKAPRVRKGAPKA